MARRGWTTQACEGCGSTEGREKGKVCGECRQLLQEAQAGRERAGREQAREARAMPWARYGLHTFYHAGQGHRSSGARSALMYALVDAVWSSAAPAPGVSPHGPAPLFPGNIRPGTPIQDHAYSPPVGLFTLEQIDAFNRLQAAVREAIQLSYEEGRADGSNLLMQLHTGDLTFKDFERRAGIAEEDRPHGV